MFSPCWCVNIGYKFQAEKKRWILVHRSASWTSFMTTRIVLRVTVVNIQRSPNDAIIVV